VDKEKSGAGAPSGPPSNHAGARRTGGKSKPAMAPDHEAQLQVLLQELAANQAELQTSQEYARALTSALEATRLELQQTDDRLRQAQKMEAVGQLAGGMAHDYNNLLTSILGYSELLIDCLPEGDPLVRNVEGIIKAAERAAALTEQIQAFKSKQVRYPKIVHFNTLLADLDKMLRRLISDNIQLVQALEPSLGAVKADPNQLKQVVLNLAINARNMMPRGGKLIIETANTNLDEIYAGLHGGVQPGAYVMLAISDTGVGLDRAAQEHIFDPPPGSDHDAGQGLTSVYDLIKQSDGKIWVYSEPGKGSTFKVYLPRVDSATSVRVPAPPPRSIATARRTETVLVAEDNEDIRNLIVSALQAQGFIVLIAQDGAEAQQLGEAHAGAFHLLLTDVAMPHKNGNEVAEALLQLMPDLKVLYMSGYTDNTIIHHNLLHPGTAYLPKPFTLDALTLKIGELLDGASATGQ